MPDIKVGQSEYANTYPIFPHINFPMNNFYFIPQAWLCTAPYLSPSCMVSLFDQLPPSLPPSPSLRHNTDLRRPHLTVDISGSHAVPQSSPARGSLAQGQQPPRRRRSGLNESRKSLSGSRSGPRASLGDTHRSKTSLSETVKKIMVQEQRERERRALEVRNSPGPSPAASPKAHRGTTRAHEDVDKVRRFLTELAGKAERARRAVQQRDATPSPKKPSPPPSPQKVPVFKKTTSSPPAAPASPVVEKEEHKDDAPLAVSAMSLPMVEPEEKIEEQIEEKNEEKIEDNLEEDSNLNSTVPREEKETINDEIVQEVIPPPQPQPKPRPKRRRAKQTADNEVEQRTCPLNWPATKRAGSPARSGGGAIGAGVVPPAPPPEDSTVPPSPPPQNIRGALYVDPYTNTMENAYDTPPKSPPRRKRREAHSPSRKQVARAAKDMGQSGHRVTIELEMVSSASGKCSVMRYISCERLGWAYAFWDGNKEPCSEVRGLHYSTETRQVSDQNGIGGELVARDTYHALTALVTFAGLADIPHNIFLSAPRYAGDDVFNTPLKGKAAARIARYEANPMIITKVGAPSTANTPYANSWGVFKEWLSGDEPDHVFDSKWQHTHVNIKIKGQGGGAIELHRSPHGHPHCAVVKQALSYGSYTFYFDVQRGATGITIGVCKKTPQLNEGIAGLPDCISYGSVGEVWRHGRELVAAESYSAGDCIGVHVDLIRGSLAFSRNGVLQDLVFNRLIGAYKVVVCMEEEGTLVEMLEDGLDVELSYAEDDDEDSATPSEEDDDNEVVQQAEVWRVGEGEEGEGFYREGWWTYKKMGIFVASSESTKKYGDCPEATQKLSIKLAINEKVFSLFHLTVIS